MSSPYRKMNLTYSPKVEESEKDLIISQLKSQIFELEQNEKNFNAINLKVRSLQNDANILSEEKLRLEYELKQRTDMSDKQILELRQTNENLQLELSEKIQVNKKLYSDNNNVFRILEARNSEINDLKVQINDLIDENSSLRDKSSQLESNLHNEKSAISSLRKQIDVLNRELEANTRNLNDLNEVLKNTQSEKNSINVRNEENKRQLSNLNNSIKKKDDNLKYLTSELDQLNNSCQNYKNKIADNERKIQNLTTELNQINNNFNSEKNLRCSIEKSNDQLETLLTEKDKENRKLHADNVELKNQLDKSDYEGRLLGNEVEKLKNHIIVLTEQNQVVSILVFTLYYIYTYKNIFIKLSDELEAFLTRDDQLKQQLDRKSRVYGLLNNNRNNLEMSLTSLDNRQKNI